MITQAKLFVASLALVATFVSCHAAPLDESKDNAEDDSRLVFEATANGHLFKVPVYTVYGEQRRKSLADGENWRQFESNKVKLLEVAELIIVKRENFSAGMKFWGLHKLLVDLFKSMRGPSETNISPLVDSVLNTKTGLTNLSNQEIYGRVETLVKGIEELLKRIPAGQRPDWNKLTIDDKLVSEYFSPVIDWLRRNGYGIVPKFVGMIKKNGNKKEKTVAESMSETN